MSKTNSGSARQAHLRWVPADEVQVNPVAQREFRPQHAANIFAKFDIDKFQVPHVNERADGTYYVMEGQHSLWAYREFFGEGQKVQVWLYQGLTEEQEAEFFLSLNDKKAIDAMTKFRAGVTAGRHEESDIDRIVRACDCLVTNSAGTNHISAIGALQSIYRGHGAAVLMQTLRTIQGAFGDGGYERPVLLGIAGVIARYSDLDHDRLIRQLAAIRNGWKGLIQRTAINRQQYGVSQAEAAAAAVVEFYNSGRGGKKLPAWWKEAA